MDIAQVGINTPVEVPAMVMIPDTQFPADVADGPGILVRGRQADAGREKRSQIVASMPTSAISEDSQVMFSLARLLRPTIG